jgi:hypothetical protein
MKQDSSVLKPRCFGYSCDEVFDSVDEMVAVPGGDGQSPRHFCESCAERVRRGPPMADGGVIEDDAGRSWDDFEYVTAEPPMIVRGAMGDLESGRCGVAYHGAAGRCTGQAEYKTTIKFDGHDEYVPLCEECSREHSPDMEVLPQ